MKTLREIMRSGFLFTVQKKAMVSGRNLMRAAIRDRDEEVRHLREYLYQVPAGSPAPQVSA